MMIKCKIKKIISNEFDSASFEIESLKSSNGSLFIIGRKK